MLGFQVDRSPESKMLTCVGKTLLQEPGCCTSLQGLGIRPEQDAQEGIYSQPQGSPDIPEPTRAISANLTPSPQPWTQDAALQTPRETPALAMQVVPPGELAVQGCGPVVREPHSQVVTQVPTQPQRHVVPGTDSKPPALQNPASQVGVTWGTGEGPAQGIPFKGLEARTLNLSRVPYPKTVQC
uniref:Uncharacterized protein n=1 Tax=Molossus molossus TaxID=27622 RepID=A0A7J8I9F8_MOLMO|nr:hypothetical protein HJG59_010501 [Molossus molossus]